MFGLFKSPPFRDSNLGELTRTNGYWRGSIALAGAASVPLVISGSRTEPDPQALEALRNMETAFISWRPTIERALFEHYGPYAEALAAGELEPSAEEVPGISNQGQVLAHASLAFVSATPLDGTLTIEIGYTTTWDEEHTLGIRFQKGIFLELCGSVLPP